MYKDFAVMFMNADNKKIGHDTFYCKNEEEARRAFRECFRHGNYIVLAVAEVPE